MRHIESRVVFCGEKISFANGVRFEKSSKEFLLLGIEVKAETDQSSNLVSFNQCVENPPGKHPLSRLLEASTISRISLSN